MSISTHSAPRKPYFNRSINKSFAANYAEYEGNAVSAAKKLAHFLALRHEPDFRYSQRLRRWLCRDGDRWRACRDEHVNAVEVIVDEAAKAMPGIARTNTAALAKEILRLAEFEPLPRARSSSARSSWGTSRASRWGGRQ